MSRSEETLYRQWVMLAHIPRYPRRVSVHDLMTTLHGEGYSIDKRTVQRDLNKLSISFPLSCDMEGRTNYWFWVKEAAVVDLPGMEPVTALAFEMAESYLLPLLPKATLDLLLPYFKRAKEVLENHTSSGLHAWSNKVRVIEQGPSLQKPVIPPEIQQTVYQALLEEKCLKANYHARNKGQAREYIIHPLGLVSRQSVLYLICTLWDYKDIKHFALHRFTETEILDSPSQQPDGFSLTSYIEQDQEFAYKQSQNLIKLEVLFDKRTAQHLIETPLSSNQVVTEHDEDRMLLTAELPDTLELRWWLQGFGDNAEVLAPTEMRAKFIELSKKLMSLYS